MFSLSVAFDLTIVALISLDFIRSITLFSALACEILSGFLSLMGIISVCVKPVSNFLDPQTGLDENLSSGNIFSLTLVWECLLLNKCRKILFFVALTLEAILFYSESYVLLFLAT